MATVKYKQNYPYSNQQVYPEQDYLYQKFLRDVNLAKPPGLKPVNVAIFGAGRAGTIHLASLVKNPRVNLLYIVEDLREKWGPLKDYWNLQDTIFLTGDEEDRVYKDENVHAVFVASPTYTHEGIVVKSVEHKKAVFCEKPIADDIEKARNCYRKARQFRMPLMCAFNRRFDPSYSSVYSRVRNGEIGYVHIIKTCSRDSPRPSIEYLSNSGGIFHDCAIHDIDMIIWILGEYPCKVSVTAVANYPEIRRIKDFDTAVIVLSFTSGTIGIIDLSRSSSYGYDQRLEVFGEKGMIKVDNQRPTAGVEIHQDITGPKKAPIWYSFPSRYREGYVNEVEHFLNVVQGLEKLRVDGRDTLAVSRIASACEESAKTGSAVEMTWGDDEVPQCDS